ncbi:MAG TPA: FliA/WhiG family RNA polymerase sigma factor [Terriglobia bacterium]|nr:FliA/WhiG family RNA polymerase sigma factor [Terriglobia bacterium]
MGILPTSARASRNLPLSERNQLVLEQLPQVRFIAQKIHARLPHHISLEDLVNTGVLGLIEALAKFDPRRNVQLQSYARYRIQGAILDSLREQDWSPRLLRQKERQLEMTREKLQLELGRAPSQAETARGLGISDHQLQLLLRDLQGLEVTSLQEPTYLEGHSLDEKMADTAEESPFVLCQRAEMNGLLEQAMSKLPLRKRQVLDLYYFKGLTMKETGTRMGVCESRVSQIHSSAVASLKARMKEVLVARQKAEESSRKRRWNKPSPSSADITFQGSWGASPEEVETLPCSNPGPAQHRRRPGSRKRKTKRPQRTTLKGAGQKVQ